MAVYLLHYERPYPRGNHPQHYIGYAKNVDARTAHHAKGDSGARLPFVMLQEGITFTVARVWTDGDKTFERYLKRQGHAERYCPTCKGESNTNTVYSVVVQLTLPHTN